MRRQGREVLVAEPVDVAQIEPRGEQGLARPDHDASARCIEGNDIERSAIGNAEAAALADRVVDDAPVLAQDAPVDVLDRTGLGGIRIMMLVVAADEGVKPQTREHLDICSLLGVPGGIVALTQFGDKFLSRVLREQM